MSCGRPGPSDQNPLLVLRAGQGDSRWGEAHAENAFGDVDDHLLDERLTDVVGEWPADRPSLQ